ncbi:sulfur carrier protein ThiS [Nocardioides caeni]|uniref:Sulfur carrier protein ThiS n=1 Tax=Nocardioides caeni TaxID=574700 RepID=A0A4S8NDB2_9ACTN|nr:sulfur carrier protein ThiS [Nocardioides caeni]THV14560.1 sulfur carrier protein ThiS [Nocardioides caeni]
MTITCNGESVRIAARTIAALLQQRLGAAQPDGVAVAVNGEVVPRSVWSAPLLCDGDVVDVVTAVQGG